LSGAKVLSQEDSKFVGLVLQGEKRKHFSSFHTFSTYYFNGPKQDPMVESQKIKINLYNLH
jgi:hypothetical protein